MTRDSTRSLPHLARNGAAQQLMVNDRPFLILGCELQNSSLTSARYMRDVWPRLAAAHVNTVLGAVTWEQIEPVEGKFCFEELDQLVLDARSHGLRLILLWFGSFKNGMSTYAPPWIKLDAKRFPRVHIQEQSSHRHKVIEVLSIFDTEANNADAKAFKALMSRLRQIDEHHSTVIMVQVENEVGLLGDSRDRSPAAETRWQQPVPANLLSRLHSEWPSLHSDLRKNWHELHNLEDTSAIRCWKDLPGRLVHIEELFMAYHYALYIDQIAAVGKSEYPIPLYTNVWQNYSGETRDENFPTVVAGGGDPGDYPSGGGVTNVLDIWQMYAPSLDLIAPDIYLNDYAISCAKYRHRGQALFIPEQRRDEYGARRVWVAFGSHGCIGTAPFGMDTLSLDENPFARHYGLLSKVSHQILQAQAQENRMIGFFFDEFQADTPSSPIQVRFGDWELTIERSFVFGKPGPGSGIIVHLPEEHEGSANQFLLVGWGFQVTFASTRPNACFTGILRFEEKEVANAETGELAALRTLNGDETRSGKFAIMPNPDPDYGGFPISVTIPANTGIAVCEPYVLCED